MQNDCGAFSDPNTELRGAAARAQPTLAQGSTLSSRTKTAAGEHETPVVLHYDDREAY